ncbi:ABC-2 type transport system permease protein [Actinopolymorpha cephalotaxi]|uniref:ABC-2 type transport system permease protein n=1 Tax=Actinopolymorpha cephalotaxi TaxID=504797 RepID=A0A1I2W1A1_9ACTN|nr:ABC transporter permease [Actinopolymorpha cephalotaxi]NYH82828.1 ABC-2 type transport system permease protein [Actinopolymorpha cephalotaxi]SFG94459.1 ABC-2 type transport system permease protein [Actinopolymorpha cephalotaxi]
MADALRAYGWIVAMWVRSTMVYRASFAMLTVGQFVVTGFDFVAIFIMFVHTDTLGGFDLPEVAFLYATSGIAMGTADLLIGSIERLGRRIRDGSLDVMLIRPVPTFVQAAADDFALRRLGRIVQSLVVFGWAMVAVDVHWTWDRIVLMPVMLVSGTVIFASIFVLGAAFQFAATDAAEVANAFTYGGNFLTQYPPTIFAKDLLRAATFGIPLAFVNWLPALHILGHPDPLGLPKAFQFASPLAAVALALVAALAWRAGLRSYRSTGS